MHNPFRSQQRPGASAPAPAWVSRHPRLYLFLAACIILLSIGHACRDSLVVRCRLGESIRLAGERRLGVDANHPVDGKYYSYRDAEGFVRYCVQAPVVSYRPEPPLLGMGCEIFPASVLGIPDGSRGGKACELQPTGRVVAATVAVHAAGGSAGSQLRWLDLHVDEILPHGMPAGAAAEPAPKEWLEATPASLSTLEVVEKPAFWRHALAFPFDYIIDPIVSAALSLLNLLTLAVCYVGIVVIVVLQQLLGVEWVKPPF